MLIFGHRILSILMFLSNFCIFEQTNTTCKRLPNGCTLSTFPINREASAIKYICHKLTQKFTFDLTVVMRENNCQIATTFGIYFRLNTHAVLDPKTFSITQTCLSARSMFTSSDLLVLQFRRINGFGIDYPKEARFTFNLNFELNFFSVRLNFYSNRTGLIKSCDQVSSEPRTIFHLARSSLTTVIFYSVKKSMPICPLIFQNISIAIMQFYYLIDTFYKSNLPKFLPLELEKPQERDKSEAKRFPGVQNVIFSEFYLPKLDASLLSPYAFRDISYIDFYGHIQSIESGLFKNFPNIRLFRILFNYFRRLCQNGGIAWMSDFNADLRLDLSTMDWLQLRKQIDQHKVVNVELFSLIGDEKSSRAEFNNELEMTPSVIFPDIDFCIYAEFPFHQLVRVTYIYYMIDVVTFDSCTAAWLFQYKEIYDRALDEFDPKRTNYTNIRSRVKLCDFTKRYSEIFLY